MNLEKNTKIGELTQKYPKVRNFLKSLSEEYKNLDNEELLEMIKDITTLEMIAIKGSFEFEDLKEKIENFINA